jgi:DNA N-6-adenine-methyltransferase (Dam)
MSLKPNDFWYTPDYVLKAVDSFFMEYGWFDPCPIEPDFDGLSTVWEPDCFINPPYSETLKNAFIARGIGQFKEDSRFLWLMNYANSRALSELHRIASAVCIPHKRIKFVPGHADLGDGGSPRYDNIFILWGDSKGFAEAFKSIGKCYTTKGSVNE